MSAEDDPEKRIRELESGLNDVARASELGTNGPPGAYLPPPGPPPPGPPPGLPSTAGLLRRPDAATTATAGLLR